MIRKSDPTKVEIEWQDGSRTVYSAKALRDLCPCAYCVDENTGVQVHDPATVPDALTTKDVRLVGHYAISVQFSDGHGTGLYSFDFLRTLATVALRATGPEGLAWVRTVALQR